MFSFKFINIHIYVCTFSYIYCMVSTMSCGVVINDTKMLSRSAWKLDFE